MLISKRVLAATFFVVLLTTEWYYIDFLGGKLRVYHFLVPLVLLACAKYIPVIAKTWTAWMIFFFLVWNIFGAFLANDQADALVSAGLLLVNGSIAFATAILLVSNRISLEETIRIATVVACLGVLFGSLQIVTYQLSGLNLGLSDEQAQQVLMGFSSGFRTEANAFAKFLNMVFLLNLPLFLSREMHRRRNLILGILVVGLLTSLTRSVLYGLSVSSIIIYIWYQISRRGGVIGGRVFLVAATAMLLFFIFANYAADFNTYAAHKLDFFFDKNEILDGGSSSFRLSSQSTLWQSFIGSEKTFWVGNGWGQVKFIYRNVEYHAGGGELIVALGYGGIVGGFLYCLYQISALWGVSRRVVRQPEKRKSTAQEGVLFALIGAVIVGQINGALIAPEYWMLLGMAISISVPDKVRRPFVYQRHSSKEILRS